MRGAIPPLPQYAFMVLCTVKALKSYLRGLKVEVKVNLFVCLNEHHTMKTYWGNGGIAPRVLNLGTRR
jgi:hypothetical protein